MPSKELTEILDVARIRQDFPALQQKVNGHPLVYLDSAASLHKPLCMVERLSAYYLEEYAARSLKNHFIKKAEEDIAEVRQKVADLLQAESDEIVFVRNSTEAINLVALAFERSILQKGDEVLITIAEHHANIVPWQMACSQTGSVIKFAPVTANGELDMEAFKQMLSEKTRIVSVMHSSNVLGTIFPIKSIVEAAHARNIPVFVDGAQAAPHMPVSVQELGCDFYAFSSHKMGGPTGVGVLYGKKQWLKKLLPSQGGGGGMVEEVTKCSTYFSATPDKFEAGTNAVAEIVAFGATIDYLEKVGRENIAKYEQQLLKYANSQLQNLDRVRIVGTATKKEPLISLSLDQVDEEKAEQYLMERGIAVKSGQLSCQPLLNFLKLDKVLRVSFAFTNTPEEIDIFVENLTGYLRKHA